MQAKKLFDALKSIVLALLLVAGISYAAGTWTAPTASPPGSNVETPINVGASQQTKIGDFTISGDPNATPPIAGIVSAPMINGTTGLFANMGIGTQNFPNLLKLNVNGHTGATAYCDTNGVNCSTASQISTVINNNGGGGGGNGGIISGSTQACARFCGRIAGDLQNKLGSAFIMIDNAGTIWRCKKDAFYECSPQTTLKTLYDTGDAFGMDHTDTIVGVSTGVGGLLLTENGVWGHLSTCVMAGGCSGNNFLFLWQPEKTQIPVGTICYAASNSSSQIPCPAL